LAVEVKELGPSTHLPPKVIQGNGCLEENASKRTISLADLRFSPGEINIAENRAREKA